MEKKDAIQSLLSAVTDLELSVQAVAFDILREEGDYQLSETFLGVARDIHAIGRRVESLGENPKAAKQSRIPAPAKVKRGVRSAYPRFLVADDRIIKVGKGKSRSAKEYRHEAPREAFDKLVAWLDEARAAGKREWSAQEAVEALDGEVPSYQTYLMISALIQSGMLAKVRRGSYEVRDGDTNTTDYWRILQAELESGNSGATK